MLMDVLAATLDEAIPTMMTSPATHADENVIEPDTRVKTLPSIGRVIDVLGTTVVFLYMLNVTVEPGAFAPFPRTDAAKVVRVCELATVAPAKAFGKVLVIVVVDPFPSRSL